MRFEFPFSLDRKTVVILCSLLTVLAAVVVLLGWLANIDSLKSVASGLPQMKPNTAFAFAVAGVGLFLLAVELMRTAVIICGVFIGLLGLTTLFQYIVGIDLPIDNLFVPASAITPANPHPGRISPHSSFNLAFVGAAMVLTSTGFGRAAGICLTAVRVVTIIALLGLLYGAGQLYGVSKQNSMALHTAVIFLTVTTGLGLSDPRSRFSEIFAGSGAGSILSRRLIPMVLIVPPVIGFLLQIGYNAGFYDTSFRLALTIGSSMVVMALILSRVGASVDRVDADRRRAEKIMAEKQARYEDLFDHSQGMICIHDVFGNLSAVNPAVLSNLGYAKKEIEGKNLRAFLPEEHRIGIDAFLREIENKGLSSGLLPVVAKDGRLLMWKYQSILISEMDKEPYVIGHALDVTELMAAQSQLRALSLKDELTGLYNRRGFMTLAEQQVKLEMHNGTARGLTILFADMDGLKAINDNHGHEAGSDAIKTFGTLMQSVVRSADVVARLGGDEFVILSIGSKDENCQQMVERIHAVLDEHNAKSGKPYRIACSIGVTPVDSNDPRTFDEILSAADEAMYVEKRRRKSDRNNINALAQPKLLNSETKGTTKTW